MHPVIWSMLSHVQLQGVTCPLCWLKHKETIMHGHDHHNTTIMSVIHNMSTTFFWPSSGWIHLSEKATQYII